jgi:predicted Rossmann fold flavoprotein
LEEQRFILHFKDRDTRQVDKLILTTGSNEMIWKALESLGHSIVPPVPSLFTFNIKDARLEAFPGISWANVEIKSKEPKMVTHGPLLITHWGLSGPAILKMSAVGAMEWHSMDYRFIIQVNFVYPLNPVEVLDELLKYKEVNPNKLTHATPLFSFTARIWSGWMQLFGIANKTWQNLSKKDLMMLADKLTRAEFEVNGKSTFKEEFVTCGGIDLNEVDMKTMQSKKIKGLYFAGEVLNIDALTGGFNFQAAWTTGWIAGETKGRDEIPGLRGLKGLRG